jgi:uroporphyrinogen decarboxylase
VRDKGIPFLYFPKGIGAGLVDMTPDVCDFVSVDWQTPIEVARNLVHHSVGLQGNLDPRALLAPSDILVKELNHYKEFRHEYPNFVFNLGHGILPDTPLENVKKMVDWVKNTQW